MSHDLTDTSNYGAATNLISNGRHPEQQFGFVNTPIYHGSTVLYPTYESIAAKSLHYSYGRKLSPTIEALQDAVAALEGGFGTRLCPSGLSAVTTMLLSFVSTGDHILVTDSIYRPARVFCEGLLDKLGVETTFYDPLIGGNIDRLIKHNTRLVYTECPGSQTMDVQDIPAIAAAAHAKGALVAIDNTWSGGHYFKPFEHGCDISVQAGTKYLVGHSDAMLGTITVSEHLMKDFNARFEMLGQCAGPDDIFLTLRGIRTLDVRLERHMKSGLEVAAWLRDRPEVAEVLHPGLEGAPGHDIWKRDFKGASGLFSFILRPLPENAVAAFFNNFKLFGMGFSWGGFESLAVPFNPSSYRSATQWSNDGQCVRLHIGLENVDDLKQDLDQAFSAMAAAA
jgi:cystathionine beta-lyase